MQANHSGAAIRVVRILNNLTLRQLAERANQRDASVKLNARRLARIEGGGDAQPAEWAALWGALTCEGDRQ